MPTTKLTPQEVARILGSFARTDNGLAQTFSREGTEVGERVGREFAERAHGEAYVARMFLDESDGGWRLHAPPEIRVRGSRSGRNTPYTRRRPREHPPTGTESSRVAFEVL